MGRYDHLPDTGTNKLARLEDIIVTTVTISPPTFPESVIADIPKDSMIWERLVRHNSAVMDTPLPTDLGVGKNSPPISVREWLAKYNSATSDTDLWIEKIAFAPKSEQLFRIEQKGTPDGQRHFLVLPDGYSIQMEKVVELVNNDRGIAVEERTTTASQVYHKFPHLLNGENVTKRKGRFKISRGNVESQPEVVRTVMGKCAILHCNIDQRKDCYEYLAVSADFDEVDEGDIVPEYGVVTNGITVTFRRI